MSRLFGADNRPKHYRCTSTIKYHVFLAHESWYVHSVFCVAVFTSRMLNFCQAACVCLCGERCQEIFAGESFFSECEAVV